MIPPNRGFMMHRRDFRGRFARVVLIREASYDRAKHTPRSQPDSSGVDTHKHEFRARFKMQAYLMVSGLEWRRQRSGSSRRAPARQALILRSERMAANRLNGASALKHAAPDRRASERSQGSRQRFPSTAPSRHKNFLHKIVSKRYLCLSIRSIDTLLAFGRAPAERRLDRCPRVSTRQSLCYHRRFLHVQPTATDAGAEDQILNACKIRALGETEDALSRKTRRTSKCGMAMQQIATTFLRTQVEKVLQRSCATFLRRRFLESRRSYMRPTINSRTSVSTQLR